MSVLNIRSSFTFQLRLVYSFVFLLSTSCFSKSETIFQVGYTDIPPLGYMNEEGKAEGGMINLMSQLLNAHNLKHSYHYFPVNRLIKNVAAGNDSQIQFVFKLDEFENKLVFDDESIFDMTLNVYWLKNKNNQISQLADLRGSSIIMTRSHDYFGFRGMIANKASANILFARGVVNGLDMLSADRADYLLSYDIFAENYQKQHDVQFEFLSLEKFEFLLAVHRSVPDAENLLSSLSKTLKEMKLSGKVDEFLAIPYKPTNN